MFFQWVIKIIFGIVFYQKAFAQDTLEEKIQTLSRAIQQNTQKIHRLKQKGLQQQKKLLIANQKLQSKGAPLFQSKPSLQQSLIEKINYPKNHQKSFFPATQFETADHKNSLSIHPNIIMNSDTFSDMQGLILNTGVNVEPIINKNTVIRNWLYSVGIAFEGKLNENIHLIVTPDFGRNQAFLSTGHVSLEQLQLFSLRAGFQKSLVSGNGVVLPKNLTYSGFSTNMAPTYETGITWYGYLGKSHDIAFNELNYLGYNHQFSYQFGVFNGTSDGAFPGLNPLGFSGEGAFLPLNAFAVNKSFEGRLFYQPFFDKKENVFEHLGLGIGASTQKPNAQSPLPTILSFGRNPIFGYANGQTFAVSSRTRYHPQFVWYKKQMGIFADWAQTTQNLTNTYPSPVLKPDWIINQTNQASEIQIFYNLTGEDFSLSGIQPHETFKLFQKGGGWGAFQIFARFSTLNIDPSTFSKNFKRYNLDGTHYIIQYNIADPRVSISKARGWSIGINWIWNTYFKIRTEFAQTRFIGGCSTGAFDDPVSPGCQTALIQYIYSPTSTVINRPNEYVAMQSATFAF